MSGGRTVNYSVHCTFKHMTGVLRYLREASSKIARELTSLDNVPEEQKNKLVEIHGRLAKLINDLTKVVLSLLEIYEGSVEFDREYLMSIQALLSTYRAEIEKVMIETRRIFEELRLKEETINAFTMDLLSCLGDIYCAEQDHIPELTEKVKESNSNN